jgi:hypothetical protein
MNSLFGKAPRQNSNIKKRQSKRDADHFIINDIERPSNKAREAFIKLIAPNNNFEDGIYSKAYTSGKKKELEEFVEKLKDSNYNVYDWNTINQDLWNKQIDDNEYEPNASKSGILVTDGKRKILVKNYNSKFYNYPKGGINKGEDPKDAAIREFTEETTINIDQKLKEKMVPKCMDWKYTLELNKDEYDELILKFNRDKFMEDATPEVSGIKLEAGEVSIKDTMFKKYLKYKNKYLELKKKLNK